MPDHSPFSLRLIPRDQHTISRKQISSGALRVLYGLHEAGFQACLVGGAVRDLLAGIKPKDFHLANLIDEHDIPIDKFCAYLGVASLSHIKASDYQKALAAIKRRIATIPQE